MARPRKMHVGMMLEIAQMGFFREPAKVWLPMIVTHLYDGNVVSGVAFSGEPGALGWMNRGAQTFDHVEKGNEGRMWRFPGVDVDENESGMVMDAGFDPLPVDDPPMDDGDEADDIPPDDEE